jgi:hypothetical protein
MALSPIPVVIRLDDRLEMPLRGLPLDAKLSEEGFLICWQQLLQGIQLAAGKSVQSIEHDEEGEADRVGQ